MTNCVILEATRGYSEEYEPLLLGYLQKQINLFATFGPFSDQSEDAIDWLCVELDLSQKQSDTFCNTTSHKDESKDEVFAFAAKWFELKNIEPKIEFAKI